MITGELRSRIDSVWSAFWSGGISKPLEVIEQITYLLFIRRLEVLQAPAENKAAFGNGTIEIPVCLPGQQHLAEVMYRIRRKRPDLSGSQITALRDQIVGTMDQRIEDYPSGQNASQIADPIDRHVHAAAVAGRMNCASDPATTDQVPEPP